MDKDIYIKNVKVNWYSKPFDLSFVEQNNIYLLTTLNVEVFLYALENKKFVSILNSNNSIVTIDGFWILKALHKKYKNLKLVKNSGSNIIYDIIKEAKNNDLKVLLLGSLPKINEQAVNNLRRIYNFNNIYGYSPPFSNYPFSKEVLALIREKIEFYKPDIIITALGVPKQEYWANEEIEFLMKKNVKLVCFFGGAIDMVAGYYKKAPKLIENLGLESVYRLFKNPKRIKRFIKQLKFLYFYFRKDY